MRLFEKFLSTLSSDALSEPKAIRFSEDLEQTDLTLLTESITRNESFPVGVTTISLGQIAEGRWLFIKPTADVGVSINGAANMTFRAGKISKMWITFTSLAITVTGAANVITIVVAGE